MLVFPSLSFDMDMPEVPLAAMVLCVPPLSLLSQLLLFLGLLTFFPAPKVCPNRKAEALDSSLLQTKPSFPLSLPINRQRPKPSGHYHLYPPLSAGSLSGKISLKFPSEPPEASLRSLRLPLHPPLPYTQPHFSPGLWLPLSLWGFEQAPVASKKHL